MKRGAMGRSAARTPAFGSGAGSGFGGFGAPDAGSSLSYLSEPPSFAAISDPNVVVSLKNVLKKDSTTKAKALEELVAHAQSNPFDQAGGVEDSLLEVWVQLYPRTSIDNARRVRELSHVFQFELMKSARKRMEKRVPKIVGAWLAGLYDRDRVVARAANDGLASFLTTPDKVAVFWKKCQPQILEYAIGAIRETQDTLSDERSTTKEDAEAKYFRIVTAALSLVLGLLQKVEEVDIEKHKASYDEFFAEDAVWRSITFGDVAVRKTACHLLFTCLDRSLDYADSSKAKQAFITGGLKTDQAGSALEYVRALTKLTRKHPDVWSASTEKKSPLARLQAFIAKGSQGSPAKFWEYLDQLLSALPSETLSSEPASKLLTSLKNGVTNRDEPRTNTSFAWKCYIDTAKRLLQNLGPDEQLAFCQEHLFPLFEQFLLAVSDKPTSIPTGPNAMTVLVAAYISIIHASSAVSSAFAEEWEKMATTFCGKIANSLPEVSKEYQSSQEKIGEEGRRWFGLVGQIHDQALQADNVADYTESPSLKVISQCISLLENRNLKPFGAARILEFALSTSSHLFAGDSGSNISSFLASSIEGDAQRAFDSASSGCLLSCLRLLGSIESRHDDFGGVWRRWVEKALHLSDESSRDMAVASLISDNQSAQLARYQKNLQAFIVDQALGAAKGSESWDVLEAATTYDALAEESVHKLAQQLVQLLEASPAHADDNLKALEIIAKSKPDVFSKDESIHTSLVAKLLSLSEIGDDAVSTKTSTIRSLIDGPGAKPPTVGIIQSNLERAGPQSLGIDTLVKHALDATQSNVPPEEVLPSTNVWMSALSPFLEIGIDPSISITNRLGGAALLVKSPSGGGSHHPPKVARDRKGRSVAARMALFSTRLLDAGLQLGNVPRQFQTELLFLQCLTLQLATDQITTMTNDGLWKTLHHTETSPEAEDLVSALRNSLNERAIIAPWWTETTDEASIVLRSLVDMLVEQASSLTPTGFYSARALSEILQAVADTHGLPSVLESRFLTTETLKANPNTVLVAAAVVTGLNETLQASRAASNLCNRLVSDIAAASPEGEKTMATLVLSSLSSQVYEPGELPITNTNRIVFAVKQMIQWLEEADAIPSSTAIEACRGLAQLLPCMKDVYGSYWEKALGHCLSVWHAVGQQDQFGDKLAHVHATLRLAKTLETMQEPNDDLEDALKDFANKKPEAVIELLKIPRDESSQPLEIVDGILCREVEKIHVRHVPELSELFGLVASESRDIQTAAFNLLHRAIPAQQEQKSVDVLLDKTDARLPDELLSLLLDAPTLEKYSDEMLAQFPQSIRSYLLSWKLIFDSYSTSSIKVRSDFTEHLKADNYIAPLQEFMFDFLGHSAAHALKLDKVNLSGSAISEYDIKLADAEPEEKSMQWLLVHLYYLTLKYIPGLFRSWYIDCRSKQTRIAVEAWTTKYFSPLIISDTLDETQKWADEQEAPAMDEQELIVKVSRAGKEVTAGYEVDEAQAAIVIKIPPSYPIDGVSVSSLRRVAVTERKWQSWIMTTQGVITFSNGSIIDGLQVFKRNIIGALKGQSECAICYSILAADKRMPDKKCTTCNHLFHRTCLYKWFQTSSQNTCPLCRNPIDYLGADTAKRRQM